MKNTNENFIKEFDESNYINPEEKYDFKPYDDLPENELIKNGIPIELWCLITERALPNVTPNRYYVSTYGNVWDTYTDYYVPQYITENTGYVRVYLESTNGKKLQYTVHRLSMMSFCYFEGCENYQVNHKDTHRDHNWIWNLEWMTTLENMQYAYSNGNARKNPYLTMTEEKVRLICEELCKKTPYEKILNKLGIYREELNPVDYHNLECLIYCIKYKKAWKYISDEYNIPKGRNNS